MLVIPISSELYRVFNQVAREKRMVFMAGLPGVGKSLLIQQLALLATQAGRIVHNIQWDVSRAVFETAEFQAHYPEIDGVTHHVVRKAVGLWSRGAVLEWHKQYSGPEHMLIGEVPLIGNRLIELIQPLDDEAEPLLSSANTLFAVPVPSWEVREVIEKSRERTIAEPQHEKERWDASPDVLRALWREVNGLARRIGLTKAPEDAPYNPYIYGGVYEALLQHRHHQSILIDEVLRPQKSVYELDVVATQLQADRDTVARIFAKLTGNQGDDEIRAAVDNWHSIVSADPRYLDPGPELRLPMPEALPGANERTDLNDEQLAALRAITALPMEADAAAMIPLIDAAIATFTALDGETILTNTKKFDIYDSYFNVTRSDENVGPQFLSGLLQAYRNVLADLVVPPQSLTVVELPLLRIALESTLHSFGV